MSTVSLSAERSVSAGLTEQSVFKKIMGAFSHNWKRQWALQDAQKDMALPQHKRTTESPTILGTRQKMIQRLF